MMSFRHKLKKVGDALTSVNRLKVFHYWRFERDAPYCIWQEDSDTVFDADNKNGEQGISGTVDYFTREEYDENIDRIQEALTAVENLSWKINSIQYEEETNLIHYEWRWYLYG